MRNVAGAVRVRMYTEREGLVSDAMTEVPLTHPMRAAWEKYKETDEYANARKWALHPDAEERQYVDGSMWAAFCEGWNAGLAARAEGVGIGHPTQEEGQANTARPPDA